MRQETPVREAVDAQDPDSGCRVLRAPALHVVLYRPEIPANTGNIARLCGAAELRLHLIHPLGFRVDDRHLRRAGLDYWSEVDVMHHESFDTFKQGLGQGTGRVIAFSAHGARYYTEATVGRGDYLLFGPESVGLPPKIRDTYPCHAVPIWGRVRSLNLSTTVGIVAYHYLHRMGKF
ncbi:MAG: tRNA (cytidine(34)-2'-O)-methyltransferase [Deltaproteobacteria bacterium]|nr:tRNA (cytidine(34)-2'-O)-methyltransferase [Deltaproteobacteria bacterium]